MHLTYNFKSKLSNFFSFKNYSAFLSILGTTTKLWEQSFDQRDEYFSWVDGSNDAHSFGWAPHEPRLKGEKINPKGHAVVVHNHCVALDPSINYKWNDKVCHRESFRGLCQFRKGM